MYAIRIMAALALLFVAACSGSPSTPTGTTQASEPANAAATFTDEEKATMTQEERAAIYNASEEEDKNQVICRREKLTGSHMSRTVCKTRGEREREREEAQETLHDVSREGFACDPLDC